jgi:hypothetical protein
MKEIDPRHVLAGLADAFARLGALEARGFELRLRDADDFVERTRVLPMMHRATGMPVDVVLAGPGPEELFLKHARHRESSRDAPPSRTCTGPRRPGHGFRG